MDRCLICGRPTIEEPLRGTFDLVLLQDTAPYSEYAVQNIDFVAGQGSTLERHITGDGTYVRFEEFAILQDMELSVKIQDSYTTRPAIFTNHSRSLQRPFPPLQQDVTNANRTFLQSISVDFLPVDVCSETLGPIQHGDLLSNRGYIVKRNQELLAAFSPASSVDAGLDAVQVMPDGQILFSIRSNVVSKAGLLSRGDILSDRGSIYLTHQDMLKNFQPTITNHDFGLNAFYIFNSGEIWFSVEVSFTDNRLGPRSAGELF